MGASLPSGTVTFLFTDIERSTELAGRLGASFAAVVADHLALVRNAVAQHSGLEVKTTGDGLFASFASATMAAAAAADMQKSISAHSWPEGGEVKMRVGLHTGIAELADDDYIGLEVHRAARIMSAGHGGQVLLSDATRALLGDRFVTKGLGPHRLAGLDRDQELFQLEIPGLPADFPPLRTAAAINTNLPTRLTSVIGREDDLAHLVDLITANRLVTLLGPGGVGKTSLAITAGAKVVEDFPGGVMFIDLSSITDPALVTSAIATELQADPRTFEGIAERLGDARALLLLDNFEQLVTVAPDLGRFIARTAATHVLVTSQVPLRIAGEQRYVLDPLPATGSPDSPGVRLFVERAKAVAPGFEADLATVADLTSRLDGLPLAIELVAARANLLTPAQMLERLETGRMSYAPRADAPARHWSLDAALEWSHELLEEPSRTVFRRLGVFAGSFSLAGAEDVVGNGTVDSLSGVGELVDRSLVMALVGATGRFRMLDGIRRFAGEQLEKSGEATAVTERFVSHYLAIAREAYDGLQGDRGEWWRSRLDDEIDNVRAMLGILIRQSRADDGLELLGNTWRFYHSRGNLLELELWLDRFSSLAGASAPTIGHIKGLMALGAVLYWKERAGEAIDSYQEAVRLAREVGDELVLADALYGLATSLVVARRTDEVRAPLDQCRAIYSKLHHAGGMADVMAADAFARLNETGLPGLGPQFEEASDLYEAAGRRTQATQAMFAQTAVAIAEDRLDDARRLTKQGIARGVELSDLFLQVWGIEYIASIELALGNHERAALLAGAGESGRARIGGGWRPQTIGLDDAQDVLVSRLGEEAAEQLLAPGRAMSLDDAVALALE